VKVSFLTFFQLWADRKGWDVPGIHYRAVDWVANRGDLAVLRCFRGFGKSTLLGIYNAWRFYEDPTYRILHQSESDPTAYKTSRDTKHVLLGHPLTKDMLREGEVEQWWVKGATDARNASMYAKGILSNVTSARADECQNDDVEVPRNIQNAEAREKLRYRLGEQTHILVPGGRKLFIGTPHTHDSLYDEIERMGADCLTIRMFSDEYRIDNADAKSYSLPFVPEFVFSGIGAPAKLLKAGTDYTLKGKTIAFKHPPGTVLDFYAGSAWPERFDSAELTKRRRETRTLNEWDSQYQLHSKPVTETRLDPDRMPAYEVEPHFDRANKQLRMWLGGARIVGASARWDPASGKLKSDVSALVLVFQDDRGRRYWHRTIPLIGEVVEFDKRDDKTIVGGQVHQICDLVQKFQLRRVTVETNGAGTFAPAILKSALKQRELQCGVSALHETRNKNKVILEAMEPLLMSGMLWAHTSVIDGPAYEQMRNWNPALADQPDDYLDATAKAIIDQPERVGHLTGTPVAPAGDDWRPNAGVYEAELSL
jgi:hypothetical protein